MSDPKTHYIDKQDMYNEIVKYHETGIISEELHNMFFMMAKRIASKPRFHGYTWKEDMITDAYLRCLKYVNAFKLTKENPIDYGFIRTNPFGYFTTVIYRVFWAYRNTEMAYQNKKWVELSNLVTKLEHEHNITLSLPENIKEKMFSSSVYGEDLIDESVEDSVDEEETNEQSDRDNECL